MRSSGLEVVPYRPELRSAFEALNREWIEAYFRMEPADERILADPEREVRQPGGEVFFLLEEGRPVGTCAVIPHGAGSYELAKMGVTAVARGRGHGDRLLRAAIDFARGRGARRLELLTNSALAPAIALYEKHGFRRVPVEAGEGEYARADVKMVLDLGPAG